MILLALALLAGATPQKIAVLDVRTGAGVEASLGPWLAQVLAKEVAERTGSAPLVSSDVQAMLGFERNKRLLGCDDEDSQCLAEITGALGVQEVLAATVSVAGGRYLVTLSLLDARRAAPLKRAAESARKDEEELLLTVRRAAWQIFGGAEPARPAPEPGPAISRRGVGLIFGGGAVLLGVAGGIAGASALSAASDGDSATARPRAHLADILFGTALLCAGAGVYLWVSGAPVAAQVSAAPGGAAAQLAVRW